MALKLRNPLHQSVRTLAWNESNKKFEEIMFMGKEVKELPEPLSSLTEQQLLNGALLRLTQQA